MIDKSVTSRSIEPRANIDAQVREAALSHHIDVLVDRTSEDRQRCCYRARRSTSRKFRSRLSLSVSAETEFQNRLARRLLLRAPEGGRLKEGPHVPHSVSRALDVAVGGRRDRADHQRHHGHGDGNRHRSAGWRAAWRHGHPLRPQHDGRSDPGQRQLRSLSIRLDSARRIQARLRTGRLRDAHSRWRAADRQLHGHDQHADGRRGDHRERAGHGRLTGRRYAVDGNQHDVRQRHARQPAERARLLGDPVGSARRQAARIDVGGSAAGTQTTYFVYGTTGQNRPMVEGINSTEGTGVVRQLRRLRIVSGSVDRQRRVERREPGAGRLHGARQQVGRQPLHGLVLRRLRVEGLAVVQHRRGADRFRSQRRRRPRAARRQPAEQLPRLERRYRRLPEEGHGLVVRVGPEPRLVGPLHELSGEAARDASGQLHDASSPISSRRTTS